MDILLYGNGGSGNHGCEAICRGTAALLEQSLMIHSEAAQEDLHYGLADIGRILEARVSPKRDLAFWKAYLQLKLRKSYTAMDVLPYLPRIRESKQAAKLALSAGGDNYCYGNPGFYAHLNRAYQKAGFQTILWGCSVEPNAIRGETAEDLARYHAIVARESISYEALRAVNVNTILAPDPAFFMEAKVCVLDPRWTKGDVIGLNVSPMVLANENISGITLENYRVLIRTLLQETDSFIALIPHVVWPHNDDRSVLQQLYREFSEDPRLILVEDHQAPELKYIISRCSFFVGARTHATIAAYSSCVPTLVVGYSVKARGIARDLFGEEKNYVLPVQALQQPEDLKNAFFSLYRQKDTIRAHLQKILPTYRLQGQQARAFITQLKG